MKFVEIKDGTVINMDAVISASIEWDGYNWTERCGELLWIRNEEENPQWRELTEEEEKELESFKTYKIGIKMATGIQHTIHMKDYKSARQKFVELFVSQPDALKRDKNREEHLLEEIAKLKERNAQLERVIESYAYLRISNV